VAFKRSINLVKNGGTWPGRIICLSVKTLSNKRLIIKNVLKASKWQRFLTRRYDTTSPLQRFRAFGALLEIEGKEAKEHEEVKTLKEQNRDDYVRANVVERYRLELGPYSILAFDICRITLLIRNGYDTGWLTEEEAWSSVLKQADRIIDQRMWWSHLDYLYSFNVGRAFGMLRDVDGILNNLREARTLLTDFNTPWLSYAPWPNFREATASDEPPLH